MLKALAETMRSRPLCRGGRFVFPGRGTGFAREEQAASEPFSNPRAPDGRVLHHAPRFEPLGRPSQNTVFFRGVDRPLYLGAHPFPASDFPSGRDDEEPSVFQTPKILIERYGVVGSAADARRDTCLLRGDRFFFVSMACP